MSAKSNTAVPTARNAAPLRPISFTDPAVTVERRDDGVIYLHPKAELGEYPARLTDLLHHWASAEPNRIFMAERDHNRAWRQITYSQMLAASRHIASGLLARGLSAERPVVILSGNSIDHALVAFGSLYAGIPFCPVSPAYSLISKDYGKLGYLMKLLTPGLVFADDADTFAHAMEANVPADAEIVASRGALSVRDATTLTELRSTPLHPSLDAAHERIGPDTIARFYSLHMLLLPGGIMALIGFHLYLVVRLGVTSPPWSREAAGKDPDDVSTNGGGPARVGLTRPGRGNGGEPVA